MLVTVVICRTHLKIAKRIGKVTENDYFCIYKQQYHYVFLHHTSYQSMTITYISKENSSILKGLALLFMVVWHLFRPEDMQDSFHLCTIQGMPLVSWLAQGCHPVGLYLFMSGYGMYFTHHANKRRGGVFLRIIKLYKTYWLTLLVFLPIAHCINPTTYPGDWLSSIENITAYRTDWNGEIWFLFPYILLVLSCKWIFAILNKIGIKTMLVATYILYFISIFLVSRYYTAFFAHHYALYHIVLYFDCLFMFVTGAAFCKCAQREFTGPVARLLSLPQTVLVVLFVVVFLFGCAIKHGAVYGPFRQMVLIILFVRIHWFGFIKKGLRFLGKYSTVVWFIHTWICYYCFKDFIHSLHYPVLMLLATLSTSIAIGYLIMKIDKYTNRLLRMDRKHG